jgi:hypothetical protein
MWTLSDASQQETCAILDAGVQDMTFSLTSSGICYSVTGYLIPDIL